MRICAIALCVAVLASCSTATREQEGRDLKRSEVEFISSRMRDATESEFSLLKHKLVTRYVDGLGQSIISRNRDMAPLPYEFRVLRSSEVLAFSLPGGVVYLSLGLLRAVELEGQLAAAISHELAHQQLNHPVIVWKKKINDSKGDPIIFDFSGGWRRHFLGPRGAVFFEKGMEQEADTLAPLILYRAGFDPRVYASYLQLLRKIELSDTERVAALLSLHPPLSERMKWAQEGIIRLPPRKDPNLSSPTFQQIKAILKETAKMKSENPAPKKPRKKKEKP